MKIITIRQKNFQLQTEVLILLNISIVLSYYQEDLLILPLLTS